ncbi:MAG: hypothetical protein FJY54_01360 [Betaproteobacteria bacterium]|nr:hypothetical protein [Betaproteobacteria bacterium]
MIDSILVSLSIMAGAAGLAGVPVRLWQFATGRFALRIPSHMLARKTFSFFGVLFLIPSVLAWIYALYLAHAYFTCVGSCTQAGIGTAVALGMLGCVYLLLEGFLLTARRRRT